MNKMNSKNQSLAVFRISTQASLYDCVGWFWIEGHNRNLMQCNLEFKEV